jgi:NhaP-type Na+/H+ or K+/H+ antiporter
MQLELGELGALWRLPGRLLLLGMPLTFAITTLIGRVLVGLPWIEAMLVAAALAPTDPVLASAIVGRREVPYRVRRLLNVESGLNDGLALPVVVVLLDVLAATSIDTTGVAGALAGGVLIGVTVPALAGYVLRRLPGRSTERYEALAPVAIGMLVFSITELTGANPFLAAFAAGSTLATVSPELKRAFERFGELISELLKLGALLVFGALLTNDVFVGTGVAGVAFAVLVLTVARALPVALALAGTGVRGKELATVAWFGPKGFASVVYGLFILAAGVPHARLMTELVALTVLLSIVVHSSTDVAIANWFITADADDDGAS